jgi:nitric oxide reductase NorQ protein
MTEKIQVDDLSLGSVLEATFWPNPLEDSRYRMRATHLDGRRAPKVVLSRDPRIVAGAACLVRILEIKRARDRGRFVDRAPGAAPSKAWASDGGEEVCTLESPTFS